MLPLFSWHAESPPSPPLLPTLWHKEHIVQEIYSLPASKKNGFEKHMGGGEQTIPHSLFFKNTTKSAKAIISGVWDYVYLPYIFLYLFLDLKLNTFFLTGIY